MNVLMMSWVAGYLPHPQYQAFLCSSGSKGYSAFRRSLEPGYPEHTILLTNVDLLELQQEEEEGTSPFSITSTQGVGNNNNKEEPFSCIVYNRLTMPAAIRPTTTLLPAAERGNKHKFSFPPMSRITGYLEDRGSHIIIITNIVDQLPWGLLEGCDSLTSADFTGLGNVDIIPVDFMKNCSKMQNIDLHGFEGVTTINSSFLAECTGLTSIDFTPMRNVTKIATWFLTECIALESINFTGLGKITKLSGYFLAGCTSLTTIDLSPFSSVTEISMWFLTGCRGLETLDLTPLYKITVIPMHFMRACTGLRTLDFTPLRGVAEIELGFLTGCASISSIDLSPFEDVRELPDEFLSGCSSITHIDKPPPSSSVPLGWHVVEPQQPSSSYSGSTMSSINTAAATCPPFTMCKRWERGGKEKWE